MKDNSPPNTHTYDFFALGEALVDLISNDVVESLANAITFERYAGGQTANLAMNMAGLGNRAALAACIGRDGLGDFVFSHLETAGVDTRHVQRTDQAPTTLVLVSRQTQTPAFIIYRGADAHLCNHTGLEEAVVGSRVIHTSAFALAREPARSTILTHLRTARQHRALITFDPNYHPKVWPDTQEYAHIVRQTFALVDVTKPSIDDATRLCGAGKTPREYAQTFLEWGAKTVLLTLGAQGVLVVTAGGQEHHVPANPVPVQDVTGAGDAFWAGFLSAHLRGSPLFEAAYFGQLLAEAKIGQIGPLATMPDWESLSSRVQKLTEHQSPQ